MVECICDDGNTGPLVNGEAVADGVQPFIVLNHEPVPDSRVEQVILFHKPVDAAGLSPYTPPTWTWTFADVSSPIRSSTCTWYTRSAMLR